MFRVLSSLSISRNKFRLHVSLDNRTMPHNSMTLTGPPIKSFMRSLMVLLYQISFVLHSKEWKIPLPYLK